MSQSQYTDASGGPVLHAGVGPRSYDTELLTGQIIHDGQLVWVHPPEHRVPGSGCKLFYTKRDDYRNHMRNRHGAIRLQYPPKPQQRRVSQRGRSTRFQLLKPFPDEVSRSSCCCLRIYG